MPANSKFLKSAPGSPPLVVAPVAETGALAALDAPDLARACDVVEFRIDGMPDARERVHGAMAACPLPCLLTVRRPDEGGLAPGLGDAQRAELYAAFLGEASLVDIEVRSLGSLGAVVDGRVPLVASLHDFDGVPPLADVEAAVAAAADAGAAVFKLAATPGSMAEAMGLVGLLGRRWPLPLAVMGMGPFGRISRLMAVRAGSVLNYGYLERANAPGQWPARQLKELAVQLFE